MTNNEKMKETLSELIKLINKILPTIKTDNVTMDSDLRTDLGIDSFHLITLAISLEDHFDIRLDESFSPKTVGDVCEYINRL